jgi:hypothetical protein
MGQQMSEKNSSLERDIMQLQFRVNRLYGEMFGPDDAPELGFVKRFDKFLTDKEARDEERDKAEQKREAAISKRHQQNTRRLNLLIAIGSGFVVPLLVVVLAELLKHWG